MKDNWKHRSKNMRCYACMYYAPKPDPNHFHIVGRCRKHAPTHDGFPVVFRDD